MVKALVFEISMRGFDPHTPCQIFDVVTWCPGTARSPSGSSPVRLEKVRILRHRPLQQNVSTL